ncbi:MAG: phospholipid carrier-dependent glycosyltransferase [bacterium]|nr:phospholipid carrier-dependent glycosyltransferase [bacterium]
MKRFSWAIFLLLSFSFFTRVWGIGIPNTYYFDEVYHAFTAQAYAQNDPQGYEWWGNSPEGFAYEWLHPPLAKLIQASAIKIFGDQPFSWRFPGILFGVGITYLLYLFGRGILKSERLGFLAALFWSLDGLSLTMSRITMNDIFLTFWVLLAIYLFLQKRPLFLVGVILGLAISTKWSGVFILGLLAAFWLKERRAVLGPGKIKIFALSFILIPATVYLLSFTQFFLQGHTWGQFLELHRQTWWYQTNLTATHAYSSNALEWPFLVRPLFAFTESFDGKVANIYLQGNPLLWWAGVLSVLWLVLNIRKESRTVRVVLLTYFVMFLPWAFSPRVMFIYHYLPALPFLFLILAWFMDRLWHNNQRWAVLSFLIFSFSLFVVFYPHWTAIPIPKEWDNLYYVIPSWR